MSFKAIGYLALTVVLVAATAGYFNGLGNDKARAAAQQNVELKAKVDALSKDSQAHKALADAAQQEIKDRDAKIASLKARRKSSPTATSLGTAALPSVGTVTGPSDEAALVDQIIAAQDEQIAALKVENIELRAALDLKDQALIISEKRARALEIARDARESAIKRNRWLGRLEGLVIGLGAGYVAGRVM